MNAVPLRRTKTINGRNNPETVLMFGETEFRKSSGGNIITYTNNNNSPHFSTCGPAAPPHQPPSATAAEFSPRKFAAIVAFVAAVFAFCLVLDAMIADYGHGSTMTMSGDDADTFVPGFRERNARNILKRLTALGPRVVGSDANEKHAVTVIRDAVTELMMPDGPVQQEGKHAGWKVEMSHQVASGSFSLLFLDNYTNVYENIQNIAVRIDPGAGNDDDALLVNCHFDSPVGSPGASDDAVNCATMLEVLRVLTRTAPTLRHPVIFLFNGAEENFMQGAHAFITQHPWRKQAKILINLEAAGSGGREILFQAGPRASWLVEIYKQATSFPVSSGFWQDIFDTGAIPSDTDFRIFRDYGGMSGLDIAFVKNGYVYHTEYDEEKRIPAETVQRIGENLHKLILALGSADWPRDNADSLRVHFDFAGLYLLTYGSTVRHLLTLLAFLATAFLMKNHAISGHRRLSVYAKQVVVSTTAVLLSWACGAIANVCVAGLMASLHTTMAYYGSMSWIVPLYVVPAWGAMSACQRLVSEWQAGKMLLKRRKDKQLMVDLYTDGTKLIFIILLLITTFGFMARSSYIPMLLLVAPAIGELIADKQRMQKYDWPWTSTYCGCQLIFLLPFAMTSLYAFWIVIPITGRAADGVNPDIIIGIVTLIFVILVTSLLMPLLILCSWRIKLERICLSVTIWTVVLVATTRVGFPYSYDDAYPQVQRIFVMHFGRSYHTIDAGSNDTLEKQDSGFWTPVLDWNTPTALYEAVPQMRRAERSNLKEDHCQKRLWCHAPYLIPAINLAPTSVIVHAPPPTIKVRMKMQHFREIHEQRNIKTINYTTSLTNGPDHIAIVVSPTSGWKIARWSFHETVTASLADPLNGQPNYYVFYSHGLPPTTPLVFWIQIQQTGEENQGSEDVKLEMLIISSYQHGAPLNDAKFQEYRRQFPDWALTIASAATIDVIRRH